MLWITLIYKQKVNSSFLQPVFQTAISLSLPGGGKEGTVNYSFKKLKIKSNKWKIFTTTLSILMNREFTPRKLCYAIIGCRFCDVTKQQQPHWNYLAFLDFLKWQLVSHTFARIRWIFKGLQIYLSIFFIYWFALRS